MKIMPRRYDGLSVPARRPKDHLCAFAVALASSRSVEGMTTNESWTWGEDPGNCEHPEPYELEESLTSDHMFMIMRWRCPACGTVMRSGKTPM